jgi:hypothetical protein
LQLRLRHDERWVILRGWIIWARMQKLGKRKMKKNVRHVQNTTSLMRVKISHIQMSTTTPPSKSIATG